MTRKLWFCPKIRVAYKRLLSRFFISIATLHTQVLLLLKMLLSLVMSSSGSISVGGTDTYGWVPTGGLE